MKNALVLRSILGIEIFLKCLTKVLNKSVGALFRQRQLVPR